MPIYELKHFPKYFEHAYPKSVINSLLTMDINQMLNDSYYLKYKPCQIIIAYYIQNNIEYVYPTIVKLDKAKTLVGAAFDDFEIFYDSKIGRWDYELKIGAREIERKYGKMFKTYFGLVIGAMNDDAICRALVNAIRDYESNKSDVTKSGIRMLYTISAIKLEFLIERDAKSKHYNVMATYDYENYDCESIIKHAIFYRRLGLTVTEDEFLRIVEKCKPPDGMIWARTPFGAPPGFVKIYLKKFTPPKYKDTDLERVFEEILNELGFKEGIDYQKQYPILSKVVDFAFPEIKVAFEPGATYWHTPKWVEGEPLKSFGLSPEEVYYPPKKEDIEKDRLFKKNGWIIGWLNENFVKERNVVKDWIIEIINSKK